VYAETMAVNTRVSPGAGKAGLRFRTFHLSWDDPIAGVEHGQVEYELSRSSCHWSSKGGKGMVRRRRPFNVSERECRRARPG
jgi:hypothetical protein